MPLHLIGYILPGLLMVLAIPMALGMVPPNRYYGFRTSKTLASPEIWYAANRIAGWWLLVGSAGAVCFNLLFWWTHADWPDGLLIAVMGICAAGSSMICTIASAVAIRKL
jgi:hypothetical protein